MSIKIIKNGKGYPIGVLPQNYIDKTDEMYARLEAKIASDWNEALTNAKEYISFHALVLIDAVHNDYKGISLQISVPVLKVSPNTYWGESDMYDHGDNYHLQVKIDNQGTTVTSFGLYKDSAQVTTDVTFYICYK